MGAVIMPASLWSLGETWGEYDKFPLRHTSVWTNAGAEWREPGSEPEDQSRRITPPWKVKPRLGTPAVPSGSVKVRY